MRVNEHISQYVKLFLYIRNILIDPHRDPSPHKQTSGLCCGPDRAVLLSAEPLSTVAVVVVDLDAILLHQLH